MTRRKRVVIADDHAVLRAGLRAFLEEQNDPELDVIGDVSSGEQAIEIVVAKRPDIVILDLAMPGLGGLGATIEIRRQQCETIILILTQHAEADTARRAFEAGANGYIVKTSRGDELLAAIRAVLGGRTYIDPSVAGSLVAPRVETSPGSEDEALSRLTARERQVLKLVAEGYSNKEVAATLGVAVKTAMAHRANLMEKLSIHNQAKLIRFAMRMGFVSDE